MYTLMKKRPRILRLPTQLQIFIKISRTEFPGNQVENFISWDSNFLTESESLLGLGKIATGKIDPRKSAYLFQNTFTALVHPLPSLFSFLFESFIEFIPNNQISLSKIENICPLNQRLCYKSTKIITFLRVRHILTN